MRNFAAMLLVLCGPMAAHAQTPAAAPTAAPAFSTSGTDLGTLLDNPATKAVLQRHVPDLVKNEQISMARGMTLKAVQQYSPDTLTDVTLANIDADLAKVPASK